MPLARRQDVAGASTYRTCVTVLSFFGDLVLDCPDTESADKGLLTNKESTKGILTQTSDSDTRNYFCICTFAQELQTVSNFCHLGVYARRLKLS